jgi:hypothetical protein
MIRRIPVPRTPLQVVVVLVAGLILVAALVEGFNALVGGDGSRAVDAVAATEGAVPEPDPEIRVEGADEIVIDFGGYDQTRVRIEGSEADLDVLARCLEDGLRGIVEEERAAGGLDNQGWAERFASKRRMKRRFREVEQRCMAGRLAPMLVGALQRGIPPPAPEAPESDHAGVPAQLRDSFERLQGAEGLDPEILAMALTAFARARERHDGVARNRLTVIDYSLPSTEKRLWVLDLDADRVLFHELVAHGKGTGLDRAQSFSNAPESLASSLGVFVTEQAYEGRHGHSLRLEGLEPGINDRAMDRAIVVHGADYVSERFAAEHGRLGRSWGCPAVRTEIAHELIDAIRDGTVLFTWYPDPDFVGRSSYLR